VATCYIVQESDGTSRFILEDGSGFLILEDCIPTPTTNDQNVMGGTPEALAAIQAQAALDNAAAQDYENRMRRRRQDDEEFMFLLTEL